jgi:ATP-dependent RNA helicase MSS116
LVTRWYASSAAAEKQDEDDFFTSEVAEPTRATPSSSLSPRSDLATPASSVSQDSEFFTDASTLKQSGGPSSVPESDVPAGPSTPAIELTPFTSLKGKVDYDILKALTVRPFQLTAMSEVQKRVLAMMPELAGGKPKRTASEGEAPEVEEVLQVNAVGQEVSTAARGKHDLLVKAKTGTGKTIVRLFMVQHDSVANI